MAIGSRMRNSARLQSRHKNGVYRQMTQKVVDLALSCGASNAAGIPAERIVLDAVFRDICQSNACGNYGKCYMCPPDVGDIHSMMEKVQTFHSAVLYQTIHPCRGQWTRLAAPCPTGCCGKARVSAPAPVTFWRTWVTTLRRRPNRQKSPCLI